MAAVSLTTQPSRPICSSFSTDRLKPKRTGPGTTVAGAAIAEANTTVENRRPERLTLSQCDVEHAQTAALPAHD